VYEIEKPILKVLQGATPPYNPVWLMRQAGRYLPEYRQLRSKVGNFLDLCLTPEWASEISLQPIRRFSVDAAIIFADILLVPMALGQKLEFREGEGPLLEPLTDEKSIHSLFFDNNKVLPVYETIVRVKIQLPRTTALIGFCGAPWTVACYMIDGNSRNDFAVTKQWAAQRPELLTTLIDVLVNASEIYLSEQIEAGADVLQLFDSWAGLLQGDAFVRWVIEPTRELIGRLKRKYPAIPIIGFPREAGEGYYSYIRQTGVDALSLDPRVDLHYAKRELQIVKPLQGNLDPAYLVQGNGDMTRALADIMGIMGPRHIINLGHGVMPQTPPENVAALVDFVHSFKF
jgi:uroporphyrinogen decarboxylase